MRRDAESFGGPRAAAPIYRPHAGHVQDSGRQEPQAALERALIDEFLAERGYTLRSVADLPNTDRDQLLRGAAEWATLRLAEIEARARFVEQIE